KSEQLVLVKDLGRDLVRRPNKVRAARATLGLELLAARRRPAALAPDPRHHIRVRRVRIVGDLPRVVPDQAVRVDAHAQLRRIVPGATARLSVKVDQGHEATRLATDDGKGERLTALVRRMRVVRVAAAARTTAGAETVNSRRWCSPRPYTSRPTLSASSISSRSRRTRSWALIVRPLTGSGVASPKL